MERKYLRERIESHRQSAQHYANLDLPSRYETAVAELDQALVLARELGDGEWTKALEGQRHEYETALEVLQDRPSTEQMHRHYERAGDLMDSGLLSNFPLALQELDLALSLARELREKRFVRTLEKKRREYATIEEACRSLFAGVEREARMRRWSSAIRLLRQMSERYGVTGRGIPGEIEDRLHFYQKADEFEAAYRQWEGAQQRQKVALLEKMGQAWQGMQELTDRLNEETRQEYSMLGQRYAGCYHELYPAREVGPVSRAKS